MAAEDLDTLETGTPRLRLGPDAIEAPGSKTGSGSHSALNS